MRLAVETLLEIVDSASNMELCVIRKDSISMVESDTIEELVAAIKKEKEEAEEAKKNKK